VLIGVFISIVLELCGLSSLAFAVGVYLPVSTSAPIMVGGLVRWLVDHRQKSKMSDAEAESGPGVLFSSGLIAGASVTGTILAMLQLSEPTRNFLRNINVTAKLGGFATSDLVAFLLFLGLAAVLFMVASERLLRSAPDGRSPAG
jgi:OPT oligopeptide transporter protein